MARDREMKVGPVLADESPAHEAVSCHGRGSVDSLHGTNGSFVIFDEILPIWSNGESAPGIENDVDEGIP